MDNQRHHALTGFSSAQFSYGRRLPGLRARLLSTVLLGPALWTMGQMLFATTAQAQCNPGDGAAPPPPPGPIDVSFANQSFGTPPRTPYLVQSPTQPGCVGPTGFAGNDGGVGGTGQSGGPLTSTNTTVRIIGGTGSFFDTFGAYIGSSGGNGGDGGAPGVPFPNRVNGGNGGPGGAGGAVTVRFDGAVLADPAMSSPTNTGFGADASGGYGGRGSIGSLTGSYAKTGGVGGTGGAGGSVSVTGSGPVQAFNGVNATARGGAGGNGGVVDPTSTGLDDSQGGDGGKAGQGGSATVLWSGAAIAVGGNGITAATEGGNGGSGGYAKSGVQNVGGAGGDGGLGGSSAATLGSGSIIVNMPAGIAAIASGMLATANGGTGGAGGFANTTLSAGGGKGGAGGAGGSASVTVVGGVTLNAPTLATQIGAQGVTVQANGGPGGAGGNATALEGEAGGGGPAGAGGAVSFTLGNATTPGFVRTSGTFAHGALVQSVGGGGGNGGQAGFNTSGGAGAYGGDGGPVTIQANGGNIVALGVNAASVLAQSVGGGGGSGGDANSIAIGASLSIGGNGGLGGNGAAVRLNLPMGVFASTSPLGGAGILAQSIGGSGGSGGSASSTGSGLLSLTIGGDAKGGGSAGSVRVTTGALVTTYGDHATGVEAQSIGGGGGKGGSAFAFNVGILPLASVAVGGRGGSGGPGGDVNVTNSGQITTYGPDAYGVKLQSIGGGGGSGGAATARAIDLSPDKRVPAVSISVATGGQGGSGNTGGTVSLVNTGLITTAGDGATAVIAQSLGGGGGTGGDSTAASYSGGSQDGIKVTVNVAVGGNGGTAGTGSAVNLSNAGLIATLGQDAYGVFAQSVGGGGGTGGAGDATGTAADAKFSFSSTVAVGGNGGSGGDAGVVTLFNTGSVLTRGDGSDGMFAQSVGGGGGAAGGGTATASGGNVAIAVGVGGNGGSGGNGGAITANNSGSIVTRGTDAIALSVQSIGGGGGKAGKGGATAGGVTPLSGKQSLFDTLAGGFGLNQKTTDLGDGILQLGQTGENIKASFDELKGIFTQPQSGEEAGSSPQFNISVGVGGTGGAAGSGGNIQVTHSGSIATYGAQSDGIYAQSVGGGGGSGGAASSTGAASDDSQAQVGVAVGGNGGGGGNGGQVTVVNTADFANSGIQTQGVAAFGIVAQSVGGGGGEGSLAGTVNGSLKSLGVGLGGNGGGAGDGGVVSVTNLSVVNTSGKHGLGILAQSIGGGGGLVRTMTTDQTFDPSKILNNPQGRVGDIHGVSLNLGGQNGANGAGGSVLVTGSGSVATAGLGAHAIVAQSIGGGGGAVIGGQTTLTTTGSGNARGDGGPVSVTLAANVLGGTQISTSGPGAAGIIAQSIGGGGGLAGDLSAVRSIVAGVQNLINPGTGNGGPVTISLNTASVTTSNLNANAIIAQSIGGGGGLVAGANSTIAYAGNATRGPGANTGGPIMISLTNSTVEAQGDGGSGIVANSAGDNGKNGTITIKVDANSLVAGGKPDMNAAIYLIYGEANRIENQGRVFGYRGASSTEATAIFSNVAAAGSTTLVNTGTIQGKIILPAQSGSFVENRLGGSIDASVIDLGAKGRLTNAGALEIGGKGRVGTTAVTGDFVHAATGTLVVDVDQASGTADRLQVNGRATVAGTITGNAVSAVRLRPGAARYTLLTASGGIVQEASTVTVGGTPVVGYELVVTDANTLSFDRTVDLGGARTLARQGLASSNRGEVGRALNTIFAGDPGQLAGLGDRLAALPTGDALAATLDALSGEAVANVQQTAFATQRLFNTTLLRRATEAGMSASSRPYATTSLTPMPPPNPQGLRVWVGGFGGSNVLDGSDGRGSLHTQIAGGLIGLDKWFDADRMVGISVGGGSTDFTVANRGGRGHGTSVQVGAYGLASFGKAYVSGVVSYGNLTTTVQRAQLGGATNLVAAGRGSVNSNILGSQVEVGWRQPVGALTLTPFAALAVDHIWQSAISETEMGPDAAGLGLRYAGTERTSVPLTLGGRVGTAFTIAGGRRMALSAELGWVHEFNTARSVQAAFSAAPAARFQVRGANAAADSAIVGFNGTVVLTNNVALLGNFTGRFAGIETAVGGFGGLQVTW